MDEYVARIDAHFQKSSEGIQALVADRELTAKIIEAAAHIRSAFARHRLYIAGNGGSAADAQHFAAELVGWYHKNDDPFPAIALSTDTSFMTAWGNDEEFANVFVRQLQAQGRPGDVFFGISTSGNSPNIVRALKWAEMCGIYTIGLLGGAGGQAKQFCQIALCVPADDTPHVQELHIAVIHALCECIKS